MAVAMIQEFTIVDHTTAVYDEVAKRIKDKTGNNVPGLLIHTAGFDDAAGVFRILDVWQTRADADRFIEQTLNPILGEVMAGQEDAPPPTRDEFYELHDVIQ